MPVSGRKPKPEGQARNRNKPTWDWTEVVDVPFADAPDLPSVRPSGDAWPVSTDRWWAAISGMPHCTLWSDSDWMFAEHTARLVAAFDEGKLDLAAEIRQREKKLGVTADDRRDLRIRYVDAPDSQDGEEAASNVTSLDAYRDL